MNRIFGWAASVALHLLVILLVLGAHLIPSSRPVEKIVVMDLSQFVPEVAPPPPPPPPAPVPEEKVPSPPDPAPIPVPAPVPEPQALPPPPGTSVGTGPAAPEPDYLPQYKIDKLPTLPTAAILGRIVYPPLAAKQGIEATVILELFIDEAGRIRRVTVLKDPGYGFAEAAEAALQGLQVAPAESGGQPVAVRYRYPVRFTLK